jgi:hypothetical protein
MVNWGEGVGCINCVGLQSRNTPDSTSKDAPSQNSINFRTELLEFFIFNLLVGLILIKPIYQLPFPNQDPGNPLVSQPS